MTIQRTTRYIYHLFYGLLFGKKPASKEWMLFSDLPNETAEQLADERRKLINGLLQENSVIRYEFLEIPGNYEVRQRERSSSMEIEEIYGQMARLKWQLNSTAYLLLERLTDLVILLIRDNEMTNFDYPLIKLELSEKSKRKKGSFIWKAVIEADELQLYADLLSGYKDWLGIPIELRKKKYTSIKLNGYCKVSGEEGTVGGNIIYDDKEYAMTCSHVLSPDCLSLLFKGNRHSVPFQYENKVYQAPDAALIKPDSPCFQIKKEHKEFLSSASEQVYITAAENKVVVNKIPESHSGKNGYISNPGSLIPIVRGKAYRFPHVSVRLVQKIYLFGLLKWPLNPHFSKGGDSGSWVIDANTNIWYGMLIGSDDLSISYLIQSEPLLDFFKYQIGSDKSLNATPFFYP